MLLSVVDLRLSETGSISTETFFEMGYEQRCQSEVIRHTKGSKVLGLSINPICERKLGSYYMLFYLTLPFLLLS